MLETGRGVRYAWKTNGHNRKRFPVSRSAARSHVGPAPELPSAHGGAVWAGAAGRSAWSGTGHVSLGDEAVPGRPRPRDSGAHSPMAEPLRKSATPKSTPTQRARMNGRRRPQLRVQRSLAEPMRGVKMRPRMGLRNQVRL